MSKFLFITTFLTVFAAFMLGVPNANGASTARVDFNNIDVKDSLATLENCKTDILPINFEGEYLGYHAAGLINDASEALKDCDVQQVDLHIINDEGRSAETFYQSTVEDFFSAHGVDVKVNVQSVQARNADELNGQGVLNIHVTETGRTV